jgi:hypothetical protein
MKKLQDLITWINYTRGVGDDFLWNTEGARSYGLGHGYGYGFDNGIGFGDTPRRGYNRGQEE